LYENLFEDLKIVWLEIDGSNVKEMNQNVFKKARTVKNLMLDNFLGSVSE
jgi:hypothetical protein